MSFLEANEESDENDDYLDDESIYPVVKPANEIIKENELKFLQEVANFHNNKLGEMKLCNGMTLRQFVHSENEAPSFIALHEGETRLSNYSPISLFDLPDSSQDVKKILSAFMVLLAEVRDTTTKVKSMVFPIIASYGEETFLENTRDPLPNNEVHFSRIIKKMKDMLPPIRWLNLLFKNFVCQFYGLYNKNLQEYKECFNSVVLYPAFDALGEVIKNIYMIDVIIKSNKNLTKDFHHFLTMMYTVKLSKETFNINARQIRRIEKNLDSLQKTLFRDNFFLDVIQQRFDNQLKLFGPDAKMSSNKEFQEAYKNYLHFRLNLLSSINEQKAISEKEEEIYILTVLNLGLYTQLFKVQETEMVQKLWGFQEKIPLIHMYENCDFRPDDILQRLCLLDSKRLPPLKPQIINLYLEEYVKKLDSNIEKYYNVIYSQFTNWAANIRTVDSSILSSGQGQKPLGKIKQFIFEGLMLAKRTKKIIDDLLLLHIKTTENISPLALKPLMSLLSILKSIENLFLKSKPFIQAIIPFIILDDMNYFDSQFSGFSQSSALKNRVSIHHVISLVMPKILTHSPSVIRIFQLQLCCPFIQCLVQSETYRMFEKRISDLEFLLKWEEYLLSKTTVTYSYKIKSFIPIFFGFALEDFSYYAILRNVVKAFEDPIKFLSNMTYLDDMKKVINGYKEEILNSFNSEVIDKLLDQIDKSLRAKSHTFINERTKIDNPFEASLFNIRHIVQTEPMIIFGRIFNVKHIIEWKLSKSFYNKCAFAPLDWQVYENMRSMAKHLYSLKTIESCLPTKKLEQGLDIIEIIKTISNFASTHYFNLHTRTFYQQGIETLKYINVIGITQVANSFHTHGIGIKSTLLLFIYKFLVKKIDQINRILYEGEMYSLLFNEIKFFVEKKDELKRKYPLECAENLGEKIKALGINEENKDILKQLREIVTEIGNAIGFVSIIKAGCMRWSYDIFRFISNCNGEDLIENSKHINNPSTKETCKLIDELISKANQTTKYSEDFITLTEVLSPEQLKSEEMKHLHQFYIVIPTLTLQYVESMLYAISNVKKKIVKSSIYFTDDGFAVGLAYLLRAFKQLNEFNSLNWFESVEKKYERDLIEEKTEKKVVNEFEIIFAKKNRDFQRGFEWLYCCYASATQYFKEFN